MDKSKITKESKKEKKARIKAFSAAGVAARRRKAEEARARGVFPVHYCRLTFGDVAFEYLKDLDRKEFTRFVSEAIIRQAKKEGVI